MSLSLIKCYLKEKKDNKKEKQSREMVFLKTTPQLPVLLITELELPFSWTDYNLHIRSTCKTDESWSAATSPEKY